MNLNHLKKNHSCRPNFLQDLFPPEEAVVDFRAKVALNEGKTVLLPHPVQKAPARRQVLQVHPQAEKIYMLKKVIINQISGLFFSQNHYKTQIKN